MIADQLANIGRGTIPFGMDPGMGNSRSGESIKTNTHPRTIQPGEKSFADRRSLESADPR